MPEIQTAPKAKRLVPVIVNKAANFQISAGRSKGGHFEGSKLLLLTSGANLVPEEVWTEAKKQSMVRTLLAAKIEATGAQEDADSRIGRPYIEEGTPLAADNPLLDLSDEDALRFVALTESLDTLKRLSTQGASAPVMQAILGRIRKIEAPEQQPAKR